MTSVTFTATAGQTDFQVPFAFLSEAHLSVYVNGVLEPLWTLVNGNTVRFDGAVVILEDSEVFIERSTPIDTLLVDFQSADSVRKREITRMAQQLQYRLQEINVEATEGMRKNGAGTAWDGQSLPLKDLGDPVDNDDAATKSYVDTALAGEGILPDPVEADIGRGIRIRASGGGSPTYQIGSVSGAVAVFKVPDQPAIPGGSNLGYGLVTNGFGSLWVSETSTRIPLELEDSFLTPEGGVISMDPNTFDILIPRGTFEVIVQGQVRNLTSMGSFGIVSADIAIGTSTGTVLDKSAPMPLGAGGGATDPPIIPGQPSFPFQACAHPSLYAILSPTVPTRLNLRGVTTGATGEAVLDVPFRVIIREIPQ